MPLTKVSAGVIAANAVQDSVGSQSITGDKIGLGAITGNTLASNIINANNIVNASITGAKIATGQITGNLLTANCVSGNNIVSGLALTGNVSVTGNVTVGSTIGVGGATPSTSGAGITFPATASASTDANTLDDYEEGTWTPVVTVQSGSTSGNVLQGTYIKIGRQITITIYATFPTTSSLVIDGFSGLPFTAENQSQQAVGSIREDSQTGYQWHMRVNLNASTSVLRRYDNNASVTNGMQFIGTTTYFTA